MALLGLLRPGPAPALPRGLLRLDPDAVRHRHELAGVRAVQVRRSRVLRLGQGRSRTSRLGLHGLRLQVVEGLRLSLNQPPNAVLAEQAPPRHLLDQQRRVPEGEAGSPEQSAPAQRLGTRAPQQRHFPPVLIAEPGAAEPEGAVAGSQGYPFTPVAGQALGAAKTQALYSFFWACSMTRSWF